MSTADVVDFPDETQRFWAALGEVVREANRRGLTPRQIAGLLFGYTVGYSSRDLTPDQVHMIVDAALAQVRR